MTHISKNKHRQKLGLKLYEKGWSHLDINPFRVADQINTYLIQNGIYERGALRIKVKTEENGSTLLILKFPLSQSQDGHDDPDSVSIFE